MSGAAELRQAVGGLGRWVSELSWAEVPAEVRERLLVVLTDSIAVTALGSRDPAQRALVAAWDAPDGPSPLFGTGRAVAVDAAAWLNAVAAVRLELDDGHRLAAGHPAAHGFPAVLALAARRGVRGAELCCALLAAYEVAARFGRATRLRPGTHPHGNWGVPGAAAGCARLLGLGPAETAAAIDAGGGLPVAGPFSAALDGNPVRDAWVGAANQSGLAAARLAASGAGQVTGVAADALGGLLGELDPAVLTGGGWEVLGGYFKQHSSCSFTHAAIDAALSVREQVGPDPAEVLVEIHSLGAGLDRTSWPTPLAARFSLPFVVATALRRGRVGPAEFSAAALADPGTAELARRVVVRAAPDLDARLPAERPVRLTAAGVVAERPNPVGDAAFHPFSAADRVRVLGELLGAPEVVAGVRERCAALPDAVDAAAELRALGASCQVR
ncbi:MULTISPECIES: MmgE/PrpD family protein [unclassified Saccharopolyspora]|uniref:MmgE/PrpD family protein n=1 Tax=unclassified Saccharopolyspora TaxID=2646250 RepID=UPI001CD45203|nr:MULTISPECIES: MmgE/PrpD family protein [unclassified Saccharopolyspora]MCA1186933.1 MmgE/PrpD family protein [Saccharopolyspora sp. 6T]MCA1192688.1 MmgE/PrpD family protein [Saccharopolyspora sp. 6V]MCA1280480.1 MmgE/PrpD family protein [Saccharopolyspora sp. 7B]